MKNKSKYLFVTILFIFVAISINQAQDITDTIFQEKKLEFEISIKHEITDSIKSKMYLEFSNTLIESDVFYAKLYSDSAYNIASNLNNNNLLGLCYRTRGIIEYHTATYKKALENYLKADSCFALTDAEFIRADNYLKMSNVYVQISMPENAINYLNKAKSIFTKLKKDSELITVKNNYALILYTQKKIDKALQIFENINMENATAGQKINNFNNIAMIYSGKNKNQKAIYFYTQAEKIAKNIQDYNSLSVIYYNISLIYETKGELKKWFEITKKALFYSEKINYKEVIQNSYQNLYRYYKKTNNYEKALEFNLLSYEKEKEISKEKNKYDIQLLTIRHKYSEAQNKNKLNELEILNNQNNIKYLLIILVIVIIAFVLVLVYFLKNKKVKKNLLQKNKEIIKVEEEVIENAKEIVYLRPDKTEQIIYTKIIELFEHKEIFLNIELSQTMIAAKLNVRPTSISKTINKYHGHNYNDFVNKYRIKYAQTLLSSSVYDKYSIAGIAQLSGYKSKTTFNNSFKKITGLTPSFYRKNS